MKEYRFLEFNLPDSSNMMMWSGHTDNLNRNIGLYCGYVWCVQNAAISCYRFYLI